MPGFELGSPIPFRTTIKVTLLVFIFHFEVQVGRFQA